jgi:queuosine precursor transporter
MFDIKILTALAVYISAIFMSNLLGLKTIPFLFGTHLSVAVFTLPLVFVTTDIIGKVYGRKLAKTFVWLGFASLALWTIFSLGIDMLPWSPSTYGRIGTAFDTIFGLSIRIALASLVAFIVSEYLDVLVFFRFRQDVRTFWVASLVSNLVSQFLDTVLFMVIAFYGVFSDERILMMAIPWWLYKVTMGLLYSPISYFILKRFQHATNISRNPQ